MTDLSTPEGQFDVVARLIARDAINGELPNQAMVDLYRIRKDQVEAKATANQARIVELESMRQAV